jgi:hypothetical protein
MEKNTILSQLTSVSEIVEAMISGVEKEWVKVNMSSFGRIRYKRDPVTLERNTDEIVCYGCAATNTLCQMVQKKFTPKNIISRRLRSKHLKIEQETLGFFESSIDELRTGNIVIFISKLKHIEASLGFDLEKDNSVYCIDNKYDSMGGTISSLPHLTNDDYKQDLHYYKQYAEDLRKAGL